MQRRVFTIGHSNHSGEHFVELLKSVPIDVLVDVRSQPASSFSPQFSREPLQGLLTKSGVQYLFLGRELGGRPSDRAMYDDEGYVRYDLVAASSDFRRGLDRLIGGIDRFRVAIMCGEEDPLHCHRRLLVGRVLVEAAIEVQHIRADGRIEAENELMERERATGGEQLGLFNDNGARSWRSIRSVLPAREPKDSLRP